MIANRDRLQELADGYIALSAKTEDPDSASELLRIAFRLLQLADPTLPSWGNIADFNRKRMFGTH
jgi:hypothetical protein